MRILFVSAEFAPLARTGGLGDVSAALPSALSKLGHDVRILLPGYTAALAGVRHERELALPVVFGLGPTRLVVGQSTDGQTLLLLNCPDLYRRSGNPYRDDAHHAWPDNAKRFGVLSRAAALLCTEPMDDGWRPDVLHCNDWHTALAPAYLRFQPMAVPPIVFTIHNLAFQGIFPAHVAADLDLPDEAFTIDGIEYYGRLSFLKGGINYADWLTTVSPTYAREIQSDSHGCGLQGLLTRRRANLSGILNGIDTRIWNPATDPHIACNYTADRLAHKISNKRVLQQRIGLEANDAVPLFGVVSRITAQKGSDLLCDIAPRLAAMPAQLAILGTGEPALERELHDLARSHPGRIAFEAAFNDPLAHLIEAGADFFLMPSRFEPCGMNQMYSQRYGTPPVVRRTGGLADSVTDCTETSLADGTATGLTFADDTAESFLSAVQRAHDVYCNPSVMQALQRNGMARDFGWTASATRYVQIYEHLTEGVAPRHKPGS